MDLDAIGLQLKGGTRSKLVNMDADGLSKNPCPIQKDSVGATWHVEENEGEMLEWHAFLCLSLLVVNEDL